MCTIRYRRVKNGLTLNKLLQKVYQRLSLALAKYIFALSKFSSFTDGAWQQEDASLHLQVWTFMILGILTAKQMQQRVLYLIWAAIGVLYHIPKINFNMSIATILKTSRYWGHSSSADNLHKNLNFHDPAIGL